MKALNEECEFFEWLFWSCYSKGRNVAAKQGRI